MFSVHDGQNPEIPPHIIDPTNRWKAPKGIYPYGAFSEGIISIRREGKFGFADRTGAIIIEPTYDHAKDFSSGLAAVGEGEKRGYIDRRGNWIVEPQFKTASDFDGEFARVRRFDREPPGAVINRQGEVLREWPTTARGTYIGVEFSEGLSCAEDETQNLYGFLNWDSQWDLPPIYTLAHSFSEGLASVNYPDGTAGYIDNHGQLVVSVPHGFNLQSFSRGLAWVETTSRRGYVNRKGDWVWSTTN